MNKKSNNNKRGKQTSNRNRNPKSSDKATFANAKGKIAERDQNPDPASYINRVMGQSNHPYWYSKNEQLIVDATKISFFNQLGAEIDLFQNSGNIYRVPGIMAFRQVTCPGYSEEATDPASLAALSVYEFIRAQLNKPNPDYEPADVIMYLLAADDVYVQYVNILRLFGITNTWSGENLYTPQALCKAGYGWTRGIYKDFVQNQANYKARFNNLIYKASTFLYFPNMFTLTDRHAWLFGNVFKDHDSNKAQYYIYSKANNWLFDETSSEQGTQLTYLDYDYSAPLYMNEMLDQFDECIDAMRSSTLVRTLVSDMRQAFNDSTPLNMGYVDDRYYLEPSMDTVALMQIENMDVVPNWSDWSGKDITQDVNKNVLRYSPWIAEQISGTEMFPVTSNRVLNLHTTDTSKDVLVEATRGMFTIEGGAPEGVNAKVLHPCADFCVGIAVVSNPDIEDFGLTEYTNMTLLGDTAGNDRLILWTAFDWAPKLWAKISGPGEKYRPVLEWDNYSVIGADTSNSVLKRINTACTLSLWSVPQFGTFTP